jgi:restriction system protein
VATLWAIHNDKPHVDFVEEGFVGLGWRAIGDLRAIGPDRDALRAAVAAASPQARPRAIPVWTGVLWRFAFALRPGDLVVHPVKADATISLGRVDGDYAWDPAWPDLPHRRPVAWLHTGVPRGALSEGARYELGASLTLFEVRRHAGEILGLLEVGC